MLNIIREFSDIQISINDQVFGAVKHTHSGITSIASKLLEPDRNVKHDTKGTFLLDLQR